MITSDLNDKLRKDLLVFYFYLIYQIYPVAIRFG